MGKEVERPLTIAEVAEETRHRRSSVERWIKTGVYISGRRVKLAALRIGGRYTISRESLAAFVADCNPAAPAPVETVAARAKRGAREQELARIALAGGVPRY